MTSGFLRAGTVASDLPRAEAGPPFSYAEADAVAHQFFDVLAHERDMVERHDDPVEHAHANGLMILFSEDAEAAFETWLARMPEPRQEAWRDLIAGGARSEAFGPLTLQERLDERQVETALVMGRRQRLINLAIALVLLLVFAAGGWWAWNEFLVQDERTRGALQFAITDEAPAEAAVQGGAPIVEPSLTATLVDTLAVAIGDGAEDERLVTPPFAAFTIPPGSLRASLFQYAGAGHVAIVGPPGFVDTTCLRASVVTEDLRPLDTVTHGPCADPVGRTAVVGCLGPSAVLLDLRIPPGEVQFPEGGSGFADAVRIQMIVDGNPDYDLLSVRATIAVDAASDVVVPRFGGRVGEDVTFDLGAGRVGTCTLTGELPSS